MDMPEFPQLPIYITEGAKYVLLGVGYHLTQKKFKEYLENNEKYKPYRTYIEYVEDLGMSLDEKNWAEEEKGFTFLSNIDFDKKYRKLINKIKDDPHFKGEPDYLTSIKKINTFLDYIENSTAFDNSKGDVLALKKDWEEGSVKILDTFFTKLSKLFGLLKKDKEFPDSIDRDIFLNRLKNLTQRFNDEVKDKYPEIVPE